MSKEDFMAYARARMLNKQMKKQKTRNSYTPKPREPKPREPRKTREKEYPTCTVPGCDKPTGTYHEYCQMHYLRLRRHGDVDTVKKSGPKVKYTSCRWPGCTQKPRRHGMCSTHAMKVQRRSWPWDKVDKILSEVTKDANGVPVEKIIKGPQGYYAGLTGKLPRWVADPQWAMKLLAHEVPDTLEMLRTAYACTDVEEVIVL